MEEENNKINNYINLISCIETLINFIPNEYINNINKIKMELNSSKKILLQNLILLNIEK